MTSLVDVATGAGHTALAFAPHVAYVIASDLTLPMLHVAQRLAGERWVRARDLRWSPPRRRPESL